MTNEEFVKNLIGFFPAETAYYYSICENFKPYIYPMDKLAYVIKDYCNSTGHNEEDKVIKIFNLGRASFVLGRAPFVYRTEVLKYDCFILCNDNIIFSDYKSIFAVIIGESSNDFILSEIIDWFVGRIHNSDVFHFFESFKSTVAKMSENRDTLSKMSVDDINNMFNLTKKRLGYD